jgi:chaperonin GroES
MFGLRTETEFTRGTVGGWQARGDQLLVRPLLTADRTHGGLFIPDDARERPQKGVVLAVGPGLASELSGNITPCQSNVGDLVLFGKYAGMAEDLGDEQVIIMRDQEALCAKPAGSYTLVEHIDGRGRPVFHEEGLTCEHCPGVDLSALRELAGDALPAADGPKLIIEG